MPAWNEHIFLLVNASEHPLGAIVFVAQVIADDLIFGVMVLLIALWIWGSMRSAPRWWRRSSERRLPYRRTRRWVSSGSSRVFS